MSNISPEKMKETLSSHRAWTVGDPSGVRANLRWANLSEANLREANLSGANLSEATLSGANLSGANLRGANLREANLSEATLSGANLSRANLSGANLREANLREANLSEATLSGANLSRANLSGCIGNMSEMISAQFDTWPVTAARMPDGSIVLQIGCQSHDLETWRKSDPRWIAALDPQATDWWGKWRDVVLAIASTLK